MVIMVGAMVTVSMFTVGTAMGAVVTAGTATGAVVTAGTATGDMAMADMHRESSLLLLLSMPLLALSVMAVGFVMDMLLPMATHSPASALD
jgi:hypothetical protein